MDASADMGAGADTGTQTASIDAPGPAGQAKLFRLLIGVYLGGGMINASINLLVPRLERTLDLTHTQALMVHLAYYSSYLVFALPITAWSVRLGYMRAIGTGLAIMATGCLAFALAGGAAVFWGLLAALLVISMGVTFLQISGNAVTSVFRARSGMAQRYTLLQAFNALGTVLGPLLGSRFILAQGTGGLYAMVPFLCGVPVLLVLAGLFMRNADLTGKRRDRTENRPRASVARSLRNDQTHAALRRLIRKPPMLAGTLAIFCYVGAEVTVATLAVDYLMRSDALASDAVSAGRLVSFYWGAAMVGRFAGAWIVRRTGAARLLALAAFGALSLILLGAGLAGIAGAAALLSTGLCNSVIFPLTYTLSLPPEERDVPVASMLLCMAVVGGAVIPVCSGLLADLAGLRMAMAIPAACYFLVLCFALGHLARNRIVTWP